MQIAQLENGKASECLRYRCLPEAIALNLDLPGIPHPSPIKARRFEGNLCPRVNRKPILDMEKIDTTSKNLTLMLLLDTQPPLSIGPAETLF